MLIYSFLCFASLIVCNTTSQVTLDIGTQFSIYSSGSSNVYYSNCRWTVRAPPAASILIRIYRFDVPQRSGLIIAAGERVDATDRTSWLAYFEQGHQDPVYVLFNEQTIGILFNGPPSDVGFHFGIEAVNRGEGNYI